MHHLVPTIAEAQAAAQALEDLKMTVNTYLIDILTDDAVKGIMDEAVAAKLRGEAVDYGHVRRRIRARARGRDPCRIDGSTPCKAFSRITQVLRS